MALFFLSFAAVLKEEGGEKMLILYIHGGKDV
jgi:hypothetical protein